MKKLVFISLSLLMLTNLGLCQSLKVTTVNPRPNVNIDRSNQTIALSFGTQILDEFRIDSGKGLKKTDVVGWFQTLKNGFKNALSDSYKVIDDKATADIILTITRAEPLLNFGSFTKQISERISSGTVITQINYAANLEYKDSNLNQRTSGTAVSKKGILRPKEANKVFQDAVESMYEAIIADLFKKK